MRLNQKPALSSVHVGFQSSALQQVKCPNSQPTVGSQEGKEMRVGGGRGSRCLALSGSSAASMEPIVWRVYEVVLVSSVVNTCQVCGRTGPWSAVD